MGAPKMSEDQVKLLIEIDKFEMILEVNQAAADRFKGEVPAFHKLAIEVSKTKLNELRKIKQQKGW